MTSLSNFVNNLYNAEFVSADFLCSSLPYVEAIIETGGVYGGPYAHLISIVTSLVLKGLENNYCHKQCMNDANCAWMSRFFPLSPGESSIEQGKLLLLFLEQAYIHTSKTGLGKKITMAKNLIHHLIVASEQTIRVQEITTCCSSSPLINKKYKFPEALKPIPSSTSPTPPPIDNKNYNKAWAEQLDPIKKTKENENSTLVDGSKSKLNMNLKRVQLNKND